MGKLQKSPTLKALLVVWIIFATAYVIYNEYNRITVFVAQNSYQQGYQESIMQLLAESSKCEPFPVTFGENKVNLINVDCLQQGESPENVPAHDVE